MTASRARRAGFRLGERTVAAGRVDRLELPVARIPGGSWLALPLAVAHGLHDGPKVWLSAAIHGDELNGVPVIRRLLKQLDPRALRGTVVMAPIVNVFGLISESRYLPDRRDLNRVFPGSKRGSLASQLAHLFMEQVVERCDLGIDLHTGSDGRTNLPQIRCDLTDERTRKLAEAFAAPVSLHASLRDGSLRAAARKLDIPVLVYEAGEAGRFDERAIEVGLAGILRILAHLDMIDDAPAADAATVACRSSSWSRASRSGFCSLSVRPGTRVAASETVATIYEPLGRTESKVRARTAGIVIGQIATALVHRGAAVVHVADPGANG